MALFDTSPTGPQNLEEALTGAAQTQSDALTQQFAKRKRRLVGEQAALGRLGSGVSDYNFSDLAQEEGNAQAGVQGNLASVLGQIPSEDYLNQRENSRKRQLAELIGRLQSPSTLEEVFGGIQGAGSLAATMAAFA